MDARESERTRFERMLRARRVHTVFQPIKVIDSGATVGYEALVRGAEGYGFDSAESLLSAAYRYGHVVEFDWLARASACRAALAHGVSPDKLLFLNIEPIALESECPEDLRRDIEMAFEMFRVVLEITERSLARDPGVLLDGIERQRPRVAGIALDDVGADTTTLTMLPLVAPSVIKLDLKVLQADVSQESLQVLDIVHEEAERTGATVLAEGIQAAAEEKRAHDLGAVLGQGYHLGKPAPLDHLDVDLHGHVEIHKQAPSLVETPFDALEGRLTGQAGSNLLGLLGQRVVSCGEELPNPALHIALLPGLEHFDAGEQAKLARLVDRGVLAAVLGPGIPTEPGRGIRGIGLRQEPPITGEWAVIALGPCACGAMLARSVQGSNDVWDYGITHDKRRVIAAAHCLFRRLGAPEPAPRPAA